jgi:SAM-dependent methyltransferase
MVPEVFNVCVPWIAEIATTPVSCLLCGGHDVIPLSTFLLNGQRFYTVRCRQDGMMWLDPRPAASFYYQLYTEHYHTSGLDDPLYEQATLDVHADQSGRREAARIRLDEIERFARPGRFLEVGFGNEYTLREAQSRGWDVLGIEIAPACVESALAQGFPAVCADFLSYGGPPESFDVVAMYSLIEHVPDPPAYLRHAHGLLRPHGLLVLRLPDTPEKGPPASLLAHIYHFNRATISELLRRCGFRVLWMGSFTVWKPQKYAGELPNMNVIGRKV